MFDDLLAALHFIFYVQISWSNKILKLKFITGVEEKIEKRERNNEREIMKTKNE